MVAECCMEIDDYIQNIVVKLDSKDVSQVLITISEIKNLIIGNNKYKTLYAKDDIISKLIDLINKYQTNYELINEIIITLGSFSKGNEYHIRKLVEQHKLHEFLLHLSCSIDYKCNENIKLIESILRCLKSIYLNSYLFYDTNNFLIYDSLYQINVLQILFKLFNLSNTTKECVINIFANTCETKEQQNLLINYGAIPNFASLLTHNVINIQLSTLKFFTALCYSNKEASKIILNTIYIDRNLCEIIATYLSRDKQIELQLFASKCLTNLYRCDCIDTKSPLIEHKTLPTLIRLCQKNIPNYILLQSIATLTYLIELSAELQETASYLEQIVPTLAHYVIYYSVSATNYNDNSINKNNNNNNNNGLVHSNSNKNLAANYENLSSATKGNKIDKNLNENLINIANNLNSNSKLIYLKPTSLFNNINLFYNNNNNNNNNNNFYNNFNNNCNCNNFNINLRLASISFQALAALAANNEEVRRRISDQDGLMNRLVESIQQNNDINLRLGALSLLHSLSRSVQQLRTKFLDHKVWTPIIDLIQSNDEQLICITAAILSNLLLEFSPSKETMIEYGVINILVKLVDHQNISIKINTMWALMNMAFQADQKVKQQILSTITMEKIFQLLTEQDENLIMKSLGLLRNLICNKMHIDQLMTSYGTKVIQAIIMILEGDYSNTIKEQALCILSNIADGNNSKEYIMGNEDLLRKINSFMTHNCLQLQIAAVFCISNLVWNTDDGANERQTKLREMGVQRILRKLLESSDPILLDKVKNSLQQFS